ncbi:MAG TPA: YciI family protein [Nitrosomonas sp.]|nr:YciI family protein [Nitrosomonas sp.]HRB33882.1 YciI family protein [Nitrosomonas sp.]HRB46794.1 YciI family protein [Nitrosomonas sp.]HRB78533.1 YciI family protein [Nitrosomonas sp.]
MKYLCLVYCEERLLPTMPDSDCVNYDESLRQSGHCVASEALQPVNTATTVRMREDKISITDGPFAETKEQLAGFYLIEAKHLDEAIEIAAHIPAAKEGSIEVRPIRPIRETVKQGQ